MKKRNILISLFIGGSVLIISFVFHAYQIFYSPVVNPNQEQASILIKPEDDIDDVSQYMANNQLIDQANAKYFRVVTKFLDYNENIKPGHYVFSKDMSNIKAVRLLRSGAQTPVRVTFNNTRLKKDLAEKICKNILADESEFLTLLSDEDFLKSYGFNSKNIVSMFLPNTYEMYWTTDAKGLFERMKREYDKFWNEKRLALAKEIGLTQQEVSTLASIVQAETQMSDEKPRVAGVYINRLNKGMLLQADPTVVFAVGDFEIKRVLNKHLETDSPYNTYKYTGLPPGPIRVPSPNSLNAVLNYERHEYLFFCASDAFNGYHNFAKTSAQHSRNAAKYRAALNKRGIYK